MTELLLAFNAGDVAGYKTTTQTHGAAISQQAELVAGQAALEQKIAILALMTLVFNRAGDERVLAFSDIDEATGVGPDGVEFLVMKAVCIGVIDATIDEVEVRAVMLCSHCYWRERPCSFVQAAYSRSDALAVPFAGAHLLASGSC